MPIEYAGFFIPRFLYNFAPTQAVNIAVQQDDLHLVAVFVFPQGADQPPSLLADTDKFLAFRFQAARRLRITLPQMKPQLLFGAINTIASSFGVFDIITSFAGFPTPNYAGHTLVAHIFDYAFVRYEMGYASAVTVILFLITFLFGRLVMFLLRSDDE